MKHRTPRRHLDPRRVRPWAVALVLLLATGVPAPALNPDKKLSHFPLDVWRTEQGLPLNSVMDVTQSADGYLWLGTQSGLVRFNGTEFRLYNRRAVPALGANTVWSVIPAQSGGLWIGTEGGGVSRYRDGHFDRLDHPDLVDILVVHLYEDDLGRLWVASDGRGLFRLQGERVSQLTTDHGLASNRLRYLIPDGEGGVWVATDGGGISRVTATGTIRTYTRQDGLPGDVVLTMCRDSQGVVWAGVYGHGLVRLEGERFVPWNKPLGLPDRLFVTALLSDRDGGFWIGSLQGLYRWTGSQLQRMEAQDGLGTNVIRSLFQDVEGSLWVGTSGGGLVRLRDGSVTTFTTRDGLSSNALWTVFEDRARRVWVGTNGAGLNCLEGDQIRHITTRDGLSHDTVLCLAEDPDGILWVGTRAGLNRIHNDRIRVFRQADGLPIEFIRVLYFDTRGQLWVGTRAGLCRLEGERFATYTMADGMTSDVIRCLLDDGRGTLWIGTNGGGVNKLRDGTFTALTTADGLINDYVFSICHEPDGTLWFATGEGLCRYRDGRFASLTTDHGLPDNHLYSLQIDTTGRMWMSSNLGVATARLADLHACADGRMTEVPFRVFTSEDGMRNRECNGGVQPASWQCADGRMLFPTVEGLVRIDPRRLLFNEHPPNVLIEELKVDGAPVALHDGMVLPPGEGRLEFTYVALSLAVPGRVRYRYQLEGFDRDWTEAGGRRVAYYTNIPPGRYTFRVSGCNNDGVWNPTGAAVTLELTPLFHQTGWAQALGIATISGLILLALRLRVLHLKRRERALRRMVDERTGQLAEANRKLQALANQDGLTGIANNRFFMDTFHREWKRSARTGGHSPLSVIMIDVDYFKSFNDTHGHQAGDDCLRRIAQALAGTIKRPSDLVARYGGEEFVALLPDTNDEGARVVAEAMRVAVVKADAGGSLGATEPVTVSLGVAAGHPAPGSDPIDLLRQADAALYQAKRSGRNRVETLVEPPTRSGGN